MFRRIKALQVVCIPHAMRSLRALQLAAFFLIIGLAPGVNAHSWYPQECCNNGDCAPVDRIAWVVPPGGGEPQLIVTSRVGTATVYNGFPIRASKDGRMHVCMRGDYGEMHVICVFIPPSV
jgi:hypothetical protein